MFTPRRPSTMTQRLMALVASLALLATACGGSSSSETAASTPPVSTDDAATSAAPAEPESDIPAVSGSTAIDGTLIEFNDLLGQDTVLWFWAPW